MSADITVRCLTPPRVFDAQHSYATPYGPRREVIPMAPARPLRTTRRVDDEAIPPRDEMDLEGADAPTRRVGRP